MKNNLSNWIWILCLLAMSCGSDPDPSQDTEKKIKFKFSELGDLSEEVDESSGIAIIDGMLVTINDKGDDAKLYFVNLEKLELESELTLIQVENKDWEAILVTDTEIIIGDTGNNEGDREYQNIIHLDRPTFKNTHTTSYSYPEQEIVNSRDHNFDCEAITIVADTYCILTKNRANDQTYLYTAPVLTSDFKLADSIAVPALVTDVYYNKPSQTLLILCNEDDEDEVHHSFVEVVSLSSDFHLTHRASLTLETEAKLEGITLLKGNDFLLASESYDGDDGKIFKLEITGL